MGLHFYDCPGCGYAANDPDEYHKHTSECSYMNGEEGDDE